LTVDAVVRRQRADLRTQYLERDLAPEVGLFCTIYTRKTTAPEKITDSILPLEELTWFRKTTHCNLLSRLVHTSNER
jgi:hypothetical protein